MSENLTIVQAYKAMFQFVEAYWLGKGKPDELGSMLGDIQLLRDEKPADPAMWNDWLEAVRKVKEQI